jgi:hypothetical protein
MNFQPRLGFVWDPFKDGRTSVRVAYAVLVDQPMTSVVTGTAGNPPLAIPLTLPGRSGSTTPSIWRALPDFRRRSTAALTPHSNRGT